jgi:hypothetical protein
VLVVVGRGGVCGEGVRDSRKMLDIRMVVEKKKESTRD